MTILNPEEPTERIGQGLLRRGDEALASVDPVRTFNRQDDEFRRNESREVKLALTAMKDEDPRLFQLRSEEYIMKEANRRAKESLIQKGIEPPPTLGNMPYPNPLDMAQRTLNTGLSLSGPENRVQDLPQLLGVRAPIDLATKQNANLNDVSDTVRTYLPAIAASIPQVRGAKGIIGLGRHLESYLLAVGAAGVGGGASEVFAEAERYRKEQQATALESIRAAGGEVSVRNVLMGIYQDMAFESLTGMVTIGPSMVSEKLMRSTGVTSAQAEVFVRDALEANMELAIRDVSDNDLVRRAVHSVGRFPSVQEPFLEGTRAAAEQASRKLSETLDAVAPSITEILEEGPLEQMHRRTAVALRSLNAAEESFSQVKGEYAWAYREWEVAAEASGSTVRPANGRFKAVEQRAKLRAGIRKVEQEDTGIVDPLGRAITREVKKQRKPRGDLAKADKALDDLLDDAEELPSVANFVGTMRKYQSLIDEVGGADTTAGAAMVDVLTGLRKDFQENLVGPPEVIALKRRADDLFKARMEVFSGKAGRLIRSIDEEFGRIALTSPLETEKLSLGTRAGTHDPIEIVDLIFGNESPAAVQEFHQMLSKVPHRSGQKLFQDAYGVYLSRQFAAATKRVPEGEIGLTNTQSIRKKLGLDDFQSPRFAATAEAFRLSGINVLEFEKVLSLVDRQFEFGVPDISQLITRRILLGGIGSGARTFAPVGGMFSNEASFATVQMLDRLASSVAFFAVLKAGGRRLADPKFLKLYRSILDPSAPAKVRARSAIRLAKLDASFLVFDNLTGVGEGPVAADLDFSREEGTPSPRVVTTPLPAPRQ